MEKNFRECAQISMNGPHMRISGRGAFYYDSPTEEITSYIYSMLSDRACSVSYEYLPRYYRF